VSESDLAEAVNEPFLAIARKQYQCEPEHAWTTWAQEQSKQDGIVADDEGKECTLRYLVRPETATSHALWLHVDSIDMPDGTRETRLIRLRDVTEKMSRQRQTWTFHALISHKFSTPLTGLINSLHLLSYEAMDMAPAEVKEFSDIALQSSQRLHKQLREIRNYIVTPDIARPGDECSVVCIEHMLATIMEETGLDTITLCGHEHLDDTYFVISKQAVELIIRELLENARKFHPQHSPTVEIELTQVSDEEVKITVCDDGVTLSPEQLARAWIPYYQAEKGFSGEVPGMGLGLAMIAALLWNIGGRYRITNREPEPGIVVELVIPLAVDKTWDSVG
jgi:signal transduction histidine kinase